MFTNRIQENVALNRAVTKWSARVTALAVLIFGCLMFGSSAHAMAGPHRKAHETNRFAHVPRSQRLKGKSDVSGSNGRPQLPSTLWNGNRPSFRKTTKAEMFSHSEDGQYKCNKCQNKFPRKGDARKENRESHITLDHKIDYRTHITKHADLETHKSSDPKGTHMFTGYSKENATKWYNDIDNLQLMCSGCNSSKNGRKDLDHLAPDYRFEPEGADQDRRR